MRKRWFAALLAACVICGASPAFSDSVRRQVSAPERYNDEWTSNSGKLTLRINAPVEIPDADAAYCVDAAPRIFTADEISAAFALLAPDARVKPEYARIYSGRYDMWRCRADAKGRVVLAEYTLVGERVTDVSLHAFYQAELERGDISAELLRSAQRPAAQHSMSPEAAMALADAAARSLDSAMRRTAWGVEAIVDISAAGSGAVDTQTEFPAYPEYYIFAYTPVIDGIPQLYTFTDCYDAGGFMFPFRCNRLYIAVDTEGVTAVKWQAPEAYGARRPCSLLPFSQIIQVARQLLPLVRADTERRYGSRGAFVHIDRITLSYCRLQKRDMTDTYSLTPVWDFFGRYGYMENGAFRPVILEDEGPYNTLLALNALDGTVIDRNYGY